MADVVQYRLERMLDELDDLEQRGLFNRREIAEIVKKRRKFEYRLKRRSPLLQDYLSYIEYETQVESLRRLRIKAVARELKKQGNKKMKKSKSDFSIVSRIFDIYELAVMRFKGNIDLWFRYLEFCKQRKNGRIKKALAKVVRFHPKDPRVWIYAASWEFDHDLNVTAARALMQNGLRVCPNSEDLWIEYLRMELTYLNKLKARKVALGEDDGTLSRDANANQKELTDEFMPLDPKAVNNDDPGAEDDESKRKADAFAEHGQNIFQTIYDGAVEALPSSLSLRKHFVEILEATNLAHAQEMRNKILNDMKREFSNEPEYWDWLAKFEYDPENMQGMSEESRDPHIQNAFKVYEEALKIVPASTMFNLYVKFVKEIIVQHEQGKASGPHSNSIDYISHLLMTYEKAETMGSITEDLACQHISLYLHLGELDKARKLAENLCSGELAASVQLWILRISVEMRCITRNSPSPTKANLLSIFDLLRGVLTRVDILKSQDLWMMALKFFANERHYFDKLVELSVVSLVKYGENESGFSLSSAIVNIVLQKGGIQHARDMYKRFLALPRPGIALYRHCIDLESDLASVGDKNALNNARKLFDSALLTNSQDINLWRDYHEMETRLGTSEKATAIYWRARKALKDTNAFIIG